MPLKSETQRRFLHAAEDRGEVPAGLAEKFEHATPKSTKAHLPYHVKKHATVQDLLKAEEETARFMDADEKADKGVERALKEDEKADAKVKASLERGEKVDEKLRDKLRTNISELKKVAEPDPDRDRKVDEEGHVQTDRNDEWEKSENYYGHGRGVKKMNTVKDLMRKKADDTGADLGKALQGVRDNAKATMGGIKPPPGSVPAPKTVAPAPGPGVPAEKKAEDAGADLGKALQGVRDNAKKTMGDIKPTPGSVPPAAPKPAVKMGPPQNIKAASAFTNMPNRADAMFFTKAAGRKDGMFFKAANEIEGYGPGSVGDAMASNPATGAIGGGMGHGKGVKAPAKKAPAA